MTEVETILLTAGVTTIGTILVTYFGHKLTVRSDTEIERERHATFLAARVSTLLDPFVMDCLDVVNDRGQRDQEGELVPETYPPTLTLPQDVDWRSIDPHMLDRILSLPGEIVSAEKTLSFIAEMISGPPDNEEWFDARRREWARIGLHALNIATDLRERYKLRKREYTTYDPRTYLEAAAKPDEETQRKWAKSIKKLIAKSKNPASKN